MKIDTTDLMALEARIAFVSSILFLVTGNFPAMIVSLALSLTAAEYANEVEP